MQSAGPHPAWTGQRLSSWGSCCLLCVTFADDTAGSDLNEAILMFWFPVVTLKNAARTQASASDITSCFHNQKETLFRLAFLITGDEAQAEASVINAYELTL